MQVARKAAKRHNARLVSDLPVSALKEKAKKNLREIFGIQTLRSLQPVAIKTALKRKSQIVVMATGGGKSLCYQLPATVLQGVTVVVSPLLALMLDQVRSLNEKGIKAEMVCSANTAKHNQLVIDRLLGYHQKKKSTASSSSSKKAKIKVGVAAVSEQHLDPVTLLYATPELIQSERFRKVLVELHKKKSLALFAIDEAHAVSEWGHDFRPAYRKLGYLRDTFPDVPCLACTATATPKVVKDIRESLRMPEESFPCHMASFNRPNISYEVRYKDALDGVVPNGSIADLIRFVKDQHAESKRKKNPCSGIVYVHKRQDTDVLANQIRKHAGVTAAAYHGGMKDADRKKVQGDWTGGVIKVAVATVAFGMGIDLAHVRYVIHWSLPKTVEGFYQESGRAGRDGDPSVSLMYYSKEDASKMAFVVRKFVKPGKESTAKRSLQGLQSMMEYATKPTCRREFLLGHFGERINPDEVCDRTCDFCKNPDRVRKAIQNSEVIKAALGPMRMFQQSQEDAGGMDGEGLWEMEWGNDDVENEEDYDLDGTGRWNDHDLRVTGGHGRDDEYFDNGGSSGKTGGSFVKASSILSRLEVRYR